MRLPDVHAFDDPLARLDAVATAEAVRSGALSAEEVVAAALARARRLDPTLGAVVSTDEEGALAVARARPSGAFGSVPTYVKDHLDVAGLPTRFGSAAFAAAGPARRTSEVAAQLLDMGMVCLGKSALSEYGFTCASEPAHAPPTRNPWNPARTSGGSSGGAAALVASGVVPIAHAADGGGSIRIPAAACGLVGLKVSRGRFVYRPEERVLPLSLVIDGVVTRTVRDTAAFVAEAARRHPASRLAPVGHVTSPIRERLRVGLARTAPTGSAVDAATARTVEDTARRLEALGHHVAPFEIPLDADGVADLVLYFGLLAWLARTAGRIEHRGVFDPSRLTSNTRGMAEHFVRRAWRTPAAIRRLRRIVHRYAERYRAFDVVLSPVTPVVAPPIGHFDDRLPHEVLFPRVSDHLGFTAVLNVLGLPAISLPLGFDEAAGVPVGVMLSADVGQEARLLGLALELEAAHPWDLRFVA